MTSNPYAALRAAMPAERRIAVEARTQAMLGGIEPPKKGRVKKSPCEKCPLYGQKQAEHFLQGHGPETATVMVVQEVPTKKQIEDTSYASGRNGKLLTSLLEPMLGPDRIDPSSGVKDWLKVYVTSAVKCRPPDGEVPSRAILLCREAYLDKELAAFQGEKVILLGVTAAHALFRRNRRLRELIGHPEVNLVPGKKVLTVWPPSAFYTGTSKGQKQVTLDIKRALAWGLREDWRTPGPRTAPDA